MRRIGFITDIKYIDGLKPLIDKISITIYDEEINKVVTISPTNFKRTYPYKLFEEVEYNKKENIITPYIPQANKIPDLTKKELQFMQKSLIAIAKDPILEKMFLEYLLNGHDILLPPQKPKSH